VSGTDGCQSDGQTDLCRATRTHASFQFDDKKNSRSPLEIFWLFPILDSKAAAVFALRVSIGLSETWQTNWSAYAGSSPATYRRLQP
jgi:hypothetical protein